MRSKYLICAALCTIVGGISLPTAASDVKPLELFGVKLKGATRDQIRAALKAAGIKAIREDKSFWQDLYDPGAELEGATEFNVTYVEATDTFAEAAYKLPSYGDKAQAGKVIQMFAAKYGKPTGRYGRCEIGECLALWERPDATMIRVGRGTYDTTTYIFYTDKKAKARVQAEMAANSSAEAQYKAKSQDRAF